MKALVIPADPQMPMYRLETECEPGELQDLVGGIFQVIGFQDRPVCAYINEESKIQGLPFNPRATRLFRSILMSDDFIAGDMVVVGAIDDEGSDTGLVGDQIEWVLAATRVPQSVSL